MTGPTSALKAIGRADVELAHRRPEHGERALGDVVLQAEDAQRRAALARRIEGRGEDVGDDLFGERGTVDDQRVLPAGLRDQGNRRAVGAQAPRQRGRDQFGDLGRAGEHDAADAVMGGEHGADRAVSRQQR